MTIQARAHGFAHPEAFALMRYRCERCRKVELVWNSRDGVTPFMIDCLAGCGGSALHIDWNLDEFRPIFFPSEGMRIFVTETREEFAARLRAAIPGQWDSDLAEAYETQEAAIEDFLSQYREGQPILVTVTAELRKEISERPSPVKLRFA